MKCLSRVTLSIFIAMIWLAPVQADIGETPSMNSKIQKLKKRAEKLHQELTVLEQDLLFPASSQIAVYVAMETASFDIDSLEMRINGVRVSNYLYSDEQVTAFVEGGIQQLYLDNIAPGYVDVAILIKGKQLFNKKNTPAKSYHKELNKRFHKGNTGLAIELVIDDIAEPASIISQLVKR